MAAAAPFDPLLILRDLQEELKSYILKGHGPFLAAIYDEQGQLIAKAANSVLLDQCSHAHAEMNAIRLAQRKLNTFDLSPFNLTLFSTSEPCLMCVGGIMWSGIRQVYYDVASSKVEKITGFDEGYKPHWAQALAQRGITVQGPVNTEEGKAVLEWYVQQGHPVYRPRR